MSDLSLIMTAAGSIVLLLFLVMKARLHAVVSLILVSMVAGLAAGMNPADIAATIQKGMGGTLGVMEVTGALDRVAHTLLGKFGVKRANWAIALTGFVCALPLFFDVAVVLLIGVAFAIVRRGGGSVVKIGIALLAGIATCQAFLIPAPGPILVASQLGADFGYMILFGLIAAVPALILAGPLFGELISKVVDVPLPADAQSSAHDDGQNLPSFGLAMGLIGLPLLLIGLKTIVGRFVEAGTPLHGWLEFIGHPFTAIMVACLAEILVDSGVGAALGNMLADSGLPIVALAFILAAAVRVIQGSATVAMLTACGLVLPMLEPLGLNGAQLAAVTIAIGGGAIVLSHVNDSGFWLANRYLGLTEKQTLQTWTVMETIIGTTGGVMAMIIYSFL